MYFTVYFPWDILRSCCPVSCTPCPVTMLVGTGQSLRRPSFLLPCLLMTNGRASSSPVGGCLQAMGRAELCLRVPSSPARRSHVPRLSEAPRGLPSLRFELVIVWRLHIDAEGKVWPKLDLLAKVPQRGRPGRVRVSLMCPQTSLFLLVPHGKTQKLEISLDFLHHGLVSAVFTAITQGGQSGSRDRSPWRFSPSLFSLQPWSWTRRG